ncbi:MAG: hypothetical protein LBQ00_06830 [Syntrophobacterales bacterium]|jgi:hypothetical protein|nr:hypothetical protein [Syntrophobacterales bacterium]
MAKIRVIAKVDGVHATSGIYLEKGKQYDVEEDLIGDEVFERVKPDPATKTKPVANKEEA